MAHTTRPTWLVRSAVLAVSLFATHVTVSHAASHRSARGKYTITSPAGWTKNTNRFMGSDVFFAGKPSKGFAPNIVVMVQPAPRGANISQAPSQIGPMMKKVLNNARIEKQGFIKLNGVRAYDLMVTHTMGTPARRLRVRSVTAIRNGMMVSFSSTATDAAYKNYAAAFNKAMSSVRWTK